MPTVSPYYKQKNIPNPYYTMDGNTIQTTINALKKVGIKKVEPAKLLFKCVDKISGKTILESRGQFQFQLAYGLRDKNKELSFGIKTTKKQVKGHLGMATRKNSTASSNVNEFLTVYFLINDDCTPTQLEKYSARLGDKPTGVITGEGTPVTHTDLVNLIDEDETAERDINIGRNNAKAVKIDIKGKRIHKLYWVPRGKPLGISPKTPSDVILQFKDKTFQGYSNKIAAGSDETPKFNTNIYAFYGKLENKQQQNNIGKLVNKAWNDASNLVKGRKAKKALSLFKIEQEPFSESASREEFSKLAGAFNTDKLDFYADGFYYPFRNNLIKSFAQYLKKPENLVYFLNTVYFYTYDDPRKAFIPCPYKLLIGKETQISQIKDLASDEDLKNLLYNSKANKIKNVSYEYDGSSQSFKIRFMFEKLKVLIPITCRTRQAGGWSGKSLFITTSGVKKA